MWAKITRWSTSWYAVTGYLTVLWVAVALVHPLSQRYLAIAQLIWLTLIALEYVEGWSLGQLRNAAIRSFGAGAGVCIFLAGLVYWVSPATGPQNMDRQVMGYLFGFWAATAMQLAKNSMLIRALFAASAIAALPFYSIAFSWVWAGSPSTLGPLITTLFGGITFVLVYGEARPQGRPSSIRAWLQLTDTK